jgi:hypothetical protein
MHMKTLNFYPYYRQLLQDEVKTTTLRLPGTRVFEPREVVALTVGWPETGIIETLHSVVIERSYQKRIDELNASDLEGESPDCRSREAVKYVLGAIYRKVVQDHDLVNVIKFKHLR